METIPWQLRLLLLALCWRTSLLVECLKYKKDAPCGCNQFLPPRAPGAADHKDLTHDDGDDDEFFRIDDMVFKKSQLTQSDYSEVASSDLNILFWPGGIIFYIIDDNFDSGFRSEILDAMKTIQNNVGSQYLEFREARRADGTICRDDYLYISRHDKRQCFSHVGMVPPDRNNKKSVTKTSLHQEACNRGTIQHELLHALGSLHEQSRPDRDEHVILYAMNMSVKDCINYKKSERKQEDDQSYRLHYETKSIMHYGSCDFSCNGHYTMVSKDGSPIVKNRESMTELDIVKMRVLYPANAKVRYTDALCRGCSHASSLLNLIICLASSIAMRLVL